MAGELEEPSEQWLAQMGEYWERLGDADERFWRLDPIDVMLLLELFARCEEWTTEARFRLPDLLQGMKLKHRQKRTLTRHLKKLEGMGLLTYLPARGRGMMGRVILLVEAWGANPKG